MKSVSLRQSKFLTSERVRTSPLIVPVVWRATSGAQSPSDGGVMVLHHRLSAPKTKAKIAIAGQRRRVKSAMTVANPSSDKKARNKTARPIVSPETGTRAPKPDHAVMGATMKSATRSETIATVKRRKRAPKIRNRRPQEPLLDKPYGAGSLWESGLPARRRRPHAVTMGIGIPATQTAMRRRKAPAWLWTRSAAAALVGFTLNIVAAVGSTFYIDPAQEAEDAAGRGSVSEAARSRMILGANAFDDMAMHTHSLLFGVSLPANPPEEMVATLHDLHLRALERRHDGVRGYLAELGVAGAIDYPASSRNMKSWSRRSTPI